MPPLTDDFEDDGRTVADMGDLRRPSLLPQRDEWTGHSTHPQRDEWTGHSSRPDFADELQDEEERRMVLLGALRAGLSLGMVYVVVFGIAIALMVWFWA